MIKKIELTSGAGVQFPFELKDQFRSAFPSAKWNRDAKRWEVGSRSIKRLDQWIEQITASGIIEDLAARDEVDMSERELEDLRRDLDRVRREIGSAEESRAEAEARRRESEELRKKLEAAKAEIAAARESAEKAKAEADAAAADVEARIAHITTRGEIEGVRSDMRKNWFMKSYARERFQDAQKKMKKIRDDLGEFGIECRAVNLAAAANFNRPDRDADNLREPIHFSAA